MTPARPLGLQYNVRQKMDALYLMRALGPGVAAAVFCDPQYRAVLDKLKFGNEADRQVERASLAPMTDAYIARLVEQAGRILQPRGHLFLWMDKYTLASAHHERWFERTTKLATVDLICWDTMRFGMGRRTRSVVEYLLVAQRHPTRAGGAWNDHSIPDGWMEQSDRQLHPHSKPYILIERLIASVTKRGDLVVDPCAGGYGVLQACKATKRTFVGCDIAEDKQ